MADDLFPEEVICNDDTLDDDAIGYKKPPKHTRFQKGVSGNPKGRPKKARDFGSELLREADSPLIVSDNGKRKRIKKITGIAKQLTNRALKGDMRALGKFLDHYLPAREVEQAAELGRANPKKYKAEDLTDDQLAEIILRGEEERKKLGLSNVLKTE